MTQTTVAASTSDVAVPTAVSAPSPSSLLDRLRADAPVALVLAACAWWLLMAPRMWGGRGAGALSGGAILTALAVVAIQPHRHVPLRAIWAALVVSVAAMAVAVAAPTGWAGASSAASYVCVSWTVIAVGAAVVRDERAAHLVSMLVVAGVVLELAESWLAWWGGSDPASPIIGTFYWYNPFAAFMIGGTLIGLSLWLRHSGVVGVLGLFGCALGTIGLVYSTSRASLACFAAGAVLVVLGHLVSHRWRGLARSATAFAVTTIAVVGVAGPPFFPHRVWPFSGTTERAHGQSLSQNGTYRLDFWREAIGLFRRHPLTGGGFHSLATGTIGHDPHHWPVSPLAHNGYLQVLSDGGLLLGIPFLACLCVLLWWVVSALGRAVRRRDFSTSSFAVALCLGAMLAHSAVDFDWTYDADFALVAILAGLVAGARWTRPEVTRPSVTGRARRLTAGAVLVGVALTGVSAGVAWNGNLKLNLPFPGSLTKSSSAPAAPSVGRP